MALRMAQPAASTFFFFFQNKPNISYFIHSFERFPEKPFWKNAHYICFWFITSSSPCSCLTPRWAPHPAPGHEPVWADEAEKVFWLQGNSLPTSEQRSACSWRPPTSVLPPPGKPQGGCHPVALLPACDICLLARISEFLLPFKQVQPSKGGVEGREQGGGGGRESLFPLSAGSDVQVRQDSPPWTPRKHVSCCPTCALGTLTTVSQHHSN